MTTLNLALVPFALIRKLSQIDLLITDSGVDEDTLAWIKAAGVETMIV